MNKVEPKGKSATYIFIVVGIAVVFVLAMLVIDIVTNTEGSTQSATQIIRSSFVDVNGDGLVDLIVYAQVIINEGASTVFP